jgi:hypothetical protein
MILERKNVRGKRKFLPLFSELQDFIGDKPDPFLSPGDLTKPAGRVIPSLFS